MKTLTSTRDDHELRLLTFYNYFRAIDVALTTEGLNNTEKVVHAMKSIKINGQINRNSRLTVDGLAKVRRSLIHSWNTQVMLYQYVGAEPDYISICLQWIPTMYYYASYHSLQAYFHASGKPCARNHTEARNTITNEISRFPGSLSATCTKSYTEIEFQNLQLPNYIRKSVSNLAQPTAATYKYHLAQLLCTTRDEYLKEAFKEKRRKMKRKNLTKTHKAEAERTVRPVGIFHFFGRMRDRFNYQDAEFVLQGESEVVSPRAMHGAIRKSFQSLTTATEWLTARYLGKTQIESIFDGFRKKASSNLSAESVERIHRRIRTYT